MPVFIDTFGGWALLGKHGSFWAKTLNFRKTANQIIALFGVVCLWSACGSSKPAQRYSQAKKSSDKGFILGTFRLAPNGVIDGDTIKVKGLDSSLRLLSIDTEETFKDEKDKRAYAKGFTSYMAAKKGDSKKPVKAATPLGEEAKVWAKDFFKDAEEIRLERDHPKSIKGRYGRYLTYVFVKKAGKWVHYNVEAVKAGMSPYFMKYGYSRRFHQEFEEAQNEARAKGLGIWNPKAESYKDYDKRLVWWNARAKFIDAFRKRSRQDSSYILMDYWDTEKTLMESIGKEVTLLGTVGSIKKKDSGFRRVLLSRKRGHDFPLIFFNKYVFDVSGIESQRGEFIQVKGIVSEYKNPFTQKIDWQIVVKHPDQIVKSYKHESPAKEEQLNAKNH